MKEIDDKIEALKPRRRELLKMEDEAEAERLLELLSIEKGKLETAKMMFQDKSVVAICHGYDAIYVEATEYVVGLNRNAMIIQGTFV